MGTTEVLRLSFRQLQGQIDGRGLEPPLGYLEKINIFLTDEDKTAGLLIDDYRKPEFESGLP